MGSARLRCWVRAALTVETARLKVYAVEHALLKEYTADGYVIALEQLVKKLAPSYVVFPHTYQVRDFAPALATRFGQVLISDVTWRFMTGRCLCGSFCRGS